MKIELVLQNVCKQHLPNLMKIQEKILSMVLSHKQTDVKLWCPHYAFFLS